MKRAIHLFLFCLFVGNLFATAQIPDRIIYNGNTLLLHSTPLDSYPNSGLIKPLNLFGSSGCFYSACWRNYVATWELIDDELFLTEIRNACYPTSMTGVASSFKEGVNKDSIGVEFADLKALFPREYKNGKVKAEWLNDSIFVQQGEMLDYVHSFFDSVYEKEIQLTFKNGKLIETKEFDNSKIKDNPDKNKKSWWNFIKKVFGW